MRAVIKVVVALDVIAVVCVILAVLIFRPFGTGGKETAAETAGPEGTFGEAGNWAMFRGGPNLSGEAPGALPDSLKLLWKFKTADRVKSSPAIVDGVVFVGSSDKSVYAIDLKSGRQVWSYLTGDAVESAPCIVEGSVYVGSSDGFLYALDAQSGSLKWKYETEGQILGAANWTQSADGRIRILVGSYDNRLHCVDSANGKALWIYETDNYINGSPAVDDGKTVFGGCDALIHVVSLADGVKVMEIDSGSYIAASAAFLDGQVYVGNYDNVFIRADLATGAIVWKYAQSDSPFFSSPAVDRSVVVVGGRDKRVHCLGRDDGKVIWTFETLGEVDSSPVICGDKVVVGSEDGRLYLLRLSDGSRVWSYETGQAITS
ncbi:MAG TPA: PQQ-binding-like beta-propeller repeat protein, partial [Sedimentisphaerales bacterium]|nr:PQQ-binding-like beta-propeller repeat protein [Sedimentisphaerales bacterium]